MSKSKIGWVTIFKWFVYNCNIYVTTRDKGPIISKCSKTQQSHSSHEARYRRPIRSQLKAINGEGAQALLLSPITLGQPGWQPTKTLSHKSSLSSASIYGFKMNWFQDMTWWYMFVKYFVTQGNFWLLDVTLGWCLGNWGQLEDDGGGIRMVFWLKNGDPGSILTVCPTSSQDHTSPTSLHTNCLSNTYAGYNHELSSHSTVCY